MDNFSFFISSIDRKIQAKVNESLSIIFIKFIPIWILKFTCLHLIWSESWF